MPPAVDRHARIPQLEVGPDVGATVAAGLTNVPRLEIGQPHFVRPEIGVRRDVMPAVAIDQDAAQAHLAHLAERDLERPAVGLRRRVAAGRAGHRPIEVRRDRKSNYRFLAA